MNHLFLYLAGIAKLLVGTTLAILALYYAEASWYSTTVIGILFVSLSIDIPKSIYENYSKHRSELSAAKEKKITKDEIKDSKKFRKEQKEFQKTHIEKRKKSEILLNKIIQNGLVREEDVLAAAKTSHYFQLVIYSYSYGRVLNSDEHKALTDVQRNELNGLTRKYPTYLEELGFIRIGTVSSTIFVINKQTLLKKFRDIYNLKRHLIIEFEQIRLEEWDSFLECLKKFQGGNSRLYHKYKSSMTEGNLPINFLITESLMNEGHIGLVGGKKIGIAPAGKNRKFNLQLMSGTRISKLKILQENKVAIREFFRKIDISFMLDGLDTNIKKRIDAIHNEILAEFKIDFVLEIANLNNRELSDFLAKKSIKEAGISDVLINSAKQYVEALEELSIQIH